MDIVKIFTEEIQEVFKERLKSVVLYGSHAQEADVSVHANVNLIIIVESLVEADYQNLSKHVLHWIKSGSPAPQVFTLNEIKCSADVFPVEFFDIKNSRKVIYGEDVFKDLKIETTNLRHQLEFELRSKYFALRKAYILSQGKPGQIFEVVSASLSSFMVLFRSILIILKTEPPKDKIEIIKSLKDKTGMNEEVFVKAYQIKNKDKSAEKIDADSFMNEYIKEIEKAVNFIDKH